MYTDEAERGYDSWEQSQLDTLSRRITRAILGGERRSRILDIGCGKGYLTSTFKDGDNEVVGIDISETAITLARDRDPNVDFRCLAAGEIATLGVFDLVVCAEVLSYIEDWRGLLETASHVGREMLVSLYLPPDPIGFVKSFADLEEAFDRAFDTSAHLVSAREQLFLFGRSRRLTTPSQT